MAYDENSGTFLFVDYFFAEELVSLSNCAFKTHQTSYFYSKVSRNAK